MARSFVLRGVLLRGVLQGGEGSSGPNRAKTSVLPWGAGRTVTEGDVTPNSAMRLKPLTVQRFSQCSTVSEGGGILA